MVCEREKDTRALHRPEQGPGGLVKEGGVWYDGERKLLGGQADTYMASHHSETDSVLNAE